MWKDSIRNIVVIFQPNILRIVGFYVRHSAFVLNRIDLEMYTKSAGVSKQLLILYTFLNQMRIGKNIWHKDDRINSL